MNELPVYNIQGEIIGKKKLDENIFGMKVKPKFIQQVVVAMQANARNVIAHTKTRGEVRGGGRKPWKQKHTGRARHGSIRSPLWKGGGVVFGPRKERVYKQKINAKVKKKALCMSLADKAQDQKMVLLENFELPSMKTKEAVKIFYNLKIRDKKSKSKKSSILFVVPEKKEVLFKSLRNINRLKPIYNNNLNLLDILANKYLIMPMVVLERIEQLYSKK